jgi:hypothetical protein
VNSFIELEGQGIFIKPESIVAIEPVDCGSDFVWADGTKLRPDPASRILIRIKGHENNPYVFKCASYASAVAQARVFAEKVDAILNPKHELKPIEAVGTEW